jgi:uncharacterized protein
MDYWQWYLLTTLVLAASTIAWLSNLLALPGNWIVVALAAAVAFLATPPETITLGWPGVLVLVGLAAFGELVEFLAGAAGAAKSGASRRSIVLSIVGTFIGGILGAILGLPIPIIGSLVASLLGGAAGAFVGAYLGEQMIRKTTAESLAAGRGAFIGRLLGVAGKLCVGAVMLVALGVAMLT